MKTAYKILKNGRSCNGGSLKWSLPTDGKPGDWHEVEGKLERCHNGLHVTTAPERFAPSKPSQSKAMQCFEAEYNGDTIAESDWGEIVARRVRLLKQVAWEEIDPSIRHSTAMQLLDLVWESEGKTSGHSHSWRRLNAAMQSAVKLAVESGMDFDEDDFFKIREKYNPSYWMHIEIVYSLAIEAQYGPNPSAYQAIEKYLGRKPFIVVPSCRESNKIRLHEGSRFQWHENMERELTVKVTSFGSVERVVDGKKSEVPCVIACSYKERDRTKYEPDKVDRVFRITHDDIAAYHKAIRDHKKSKAS